MDEHTQAAIAKGGLPIKLTWSGINLRVTVEQKIDGVKTKNELEILKNVDGFAMPGTATFIMGASGSGKTSLLNVLSDRVNLKGKKKEGTVMFNDRVPVTQRSYGQVGSYVMQDDILFEFFTVKEALTFAARLRLSTSEEEQDRRV